MHHASSADLSTLHLLMIWYTLHCSRRFCEKPSTSQHQVNYRRFQHLYVCQALEQLVDSHISRQHKQSRGTHYNARRHYNALRSCSTAIPAASVAPSQPLHSCLRTLTLCTTANEQQFCNQAQMLAWTIDSAWSTRHERHDNSSMLRSATCLTLRSAL